MRRTLLHETEEGCDQAIADGECAPNGAHEQCFGFENDGLHFNYGMGTNNSAKWLEHRMMDGVLEMSPATEAS